MRPSLPRFSFGFVLPAFVLAAFSLVFADPGRKPTKQRPLAPDPTRATVIQQQPSDGGWCPSGEDLSQLLEAREKLPSRLTVGRGRDVPPPPVVTSPNGVLLIEDSGLILQNDRIFDLPPATLEFSPSANGYKIISKASEYEPVAGAPLFSNSNQWRADPVNLTQFSFPFGGQARTQFWVTPTNLIAFEPPTQPVKIGLCSEGCYFAEGNVLLDRSPRLSPLEHGSYFYGWNAWVEEQADRVIVTWRYDDPAVLDVQAVLFDDGTIHFNYNAVAGGLEWGAPVVIDGNAGFWSDLQPAGSTNDPAGDVTVPGPDGPALNFLSATASQIGTTELLQVEFELGGAPPFEPEMQDLYWQIELRDEPLDEEPLGSFLIQWRHGIVRFATEPVKIEGATFRLNLRLLELNLADDDLHLRFSSFRGTSPPYVTEDAMELTVGFTVPTAPLMLDLSDDLPVILGDRPLYESFTLPDLRPGEVLETLAPLFEEIPTVEAFAIYQNLQTDLFFFGGGYHAGGNSGADGVGFGSSEVERSPSLLHVNNIYSYGPEDWAMTVLNHELGHRWLYHFEIEEGGVPTRNLNPVSSHPAGWVYTPAVNPVYYPLDYSVMGGSFWNDNGNGTFTTPPSNQGGPNGYTWHELYLIGLAGADEVEGWWYIENPSPPVTSQYWANNDTTVSGNRIPVGIEQLVAAEGPRFPAYPDSLQSFLTPVVLVVRPGEVLQNEIDTVDYICTLWEQRFFTATDGRGSLRCRFHRPEVEINSPVSDVNILAGDRIDFVGSATDGDAEAVELRWDFSGVIPETTGTGPHQVIFSTTGDYPVVLSGVDASGVLAEEETRLISVACPNAPPTETVNGLLLDKEAGGIRFRWTDLPVSPGDYAILGGSAVQGPLFPAGFGPDGATGVLLAEPEGDVFYKVAARSAAGCLGPE